MRKYILELLESSNWKFLSQTDIQLFNEGMHHLISIFNNEIVFSIDNNIIDNLDDDITFNLYCKLKNVIVNNQIYNNENKPRTVLLSKNQNIALLALIIQQGINQIYIYKIDPRVGVPIINRYDNIKLGIYWFNKSLSDSLENGWIIINNNQKNIG